MHLITFAFRLVCQKPLKFYHENPELFLDKVNRKHGATFVKKAVRKGPEEDSDSEEEDDEEPEKR